ncbi:MAG: hypothetical protein JO289_14665 [Xanthobacteraceae bacterium]|nr:hypothetical protein [Xanthobacteraceae bacterium]
MSTAVDQRREGIIAKRRDSRYPPLTRERIKIKNPAHPAIERAMLIGLNKRQRPGVMETQ